MKKLIAISFLFVFLCANTELHQLLRLPILVHHFLEHQEQEPEKTFADFLQEHYLAVQSHSHNDDHNDHDHLPFKTTDCATAHLSLAFVMGAQFSILRPNTLHSPVFPTHNQTFYFSDVVSNIWQPPKIS